MEDETHSLTGFVVPRLIFTRGDFTKAEWSNGRWSVPFCVIAAIWNREFCESSGRLPPPFFFRELKADSPPRRRG